MAGAVAALSLAPRPVVLLDPVPAGGEAASRWAQGGLAAAVGPDDSPAIQTGDTLNAGAGLVDAEAAARIIGSGPATVAALERFGVRFDRGPDGAFALGLEAAHSRRRILHVRDATGRAIVEALGVRIAKTPSIERLAARAVTLVLNDGAISGIWIRLGGDTLLVPTSQVILATGGVGGLWRSTTNPIPAQGAGILMAAKAGAVLADLEFMQFHPTALAVGIDPMPLVSEAVRGEGAVLVDADGNRFMAGIQGGDLAPRDVVAREVFAEWAKGGSAALDARNWPSGKFARRFPNIHAVLAAHGIDPERRPIPVRPAAHYHMGGVEVDAQGRSSVAGLWACGEVACTGLHGANRLASNSLLEAAVCGILVAESVAGCDAPGLVPERRDPPPALPPGGEKLDRVRDLMDRDVGVVRDAKGLARAVAQLEGMIGSPERTAADGPAAVALMIARAALTRKERCGAHWRADATEPTTPSRSAMRWDDLRPPT
jgi:L-aspartate oxidase